MAATLAHRGPDDEGLWVDPDGRTAFGHRRLAVVDLSPHGHQPMASADGRWILSYNGEIYNFPTLRTQLEAEGMSFRGGSDTEVVVGAVQAWGVEATMQRIEGMFAIALWDRRRAELHLVRDRFGEKPLYYGWVGRRLAFASELKAFRTLPDFVPTLDRAAVASFLRHNCIPAPATAYAGVAKLQPGRWITFAADAGPDSQPHSRAYWSASDAIADAMLQPETGTERPADRPSRGGPVRLRGGPDGRRRPRRGLPVRRSRLERHRGPDAAGGPAAGAHLLRGLRRPRLRRVGGRGGGGRPPGDRPHVVAGDRRRRRGGHPPTCGDLGRAVRRRVADPHAAGERARPFPGHGGALGGRGRRTVRRVQPPRLARSPVAPRCRAARSGATADGLRPAGPAAGPRRRRRRRHPRPPGADAGADTVHQGGEGRTGARLVRPRGGLSLPDFTLGGRRVRGRRGASPRDRVRG